MRFLGSLPFEDSAKNFAPKISQGPFRNLPPRPQQQHTTQRDTMTLSILRGSAQRLPRVLWRRRISTSPPHNNHHPPIAPLSPPVAEAVVPSPVDVMPPFARYSHGSQVSLTPTTRLVLVSGQLGISPDGSIPLDDAEAQADVCLRNVRAVLAATHGQGAGAGAVLPVPLGGNPRAQHHHRAPRVNTSPSTYSTLVPECTSGSTRIHTELYFLLASLCGPGHRGAMGMGHLVRLNAYVTDRAHLPAYMRARDRMLEGEEWPHGPPASTLMVVSGFARPEFLVEVEAVAAA